MTDTTTEAIDIKQLEWLESAIAERGPHDAIEYFSDEDRVLDLLNREEVAHMRTKVNLQDVIARAEKAEAERDAAIKLSKCAQDTLDAWFDRRKLAHDAIDSAVIDAVAGYLRTSRVGGMPQDESDLILGVIQDMARLSLFADLFARAITVADVLAKVGAK